MARLGFARPVSRKLKCRNETAASAASATWLSRRAARQCFSNVPTSGTLPALHACGSTAGSSGGRATFAA